MNARFAQLIDQNPLSIRDKPIHEHWLKTKGYDIPNWYREVYLKTDHWHEVQNCCYVYFGGHCSLCGKGRVPFHIHHNNYKCFWKERYNDVIYLCSRNHSEYHNLLQIDKVTGKPKWEIKEEWFWESLDIRDELFNTIYNCYKMLEDLYLTSK